MRIKPKTKYQPKVYCPHCKVEITDSLIEYYAKELSLLARRALAVLRAAQELNKNAHGNNQPTTKGNAR